ncbi:hypothetical protein A9Q99_03280 [Gammaproteobacteria bacterium 45_16_T64]|nr:hypothetical protein A9Q99_03280 [Gammaproteobacteria bacterium 45_16_T64]
MLYIDDQFYDTDYFLEHTRALEKHTIFLGNSSVRIAVCLEDYSLWLAICFFCKSSNISVMPIHPSTPLDAAKRLSKKAKCHYLFYGNMETVVPLETNAEACNGGSNEGRSSHGIIQMSSGTTGDPKCIERSWRSIDIEISSYVETLTIAKNMTPVIACPITHSYGLISGLLVALARGVTPRVITNINPKYLIKVLQANDNALLYSSPTMLQTIASLWPAEKKIHAAMTSGTVMSKLTFDTLAPKVTHLFQQYGCSEVGCIAVNQHLTQTMDVGTPLPHLKVAAGTSVKDAGEITVSFTSYDADIHGPTQSIRTRDLGYLESNEQHPPMLSFVSRLDDTIIVAGLNVYPAEIEDIILTHPAIADVVIFKRDDAYAGQRVCLHYVTNANISSNELRQWCADQMAPYQVPQQLEHVDRINRLANGKINRRLIAQEYEALLTQQKNAKHKSAQPQV